jgi:hypothetical protein
VTIPSQFYAERPNPERKAIDGLSSLGIARAPHSVRTVVDTSRGCVR